MRFVLIIIFLSAIFTIKAQDTLVLKDGKRLAVIIVNVNQNTITYKFYSNPNGKSLRIDYEKVDRIIYKNGDTTSKDVANKPNSKARVLKCNRINIDLFGVGVNLAPRTFSYERINAKGTVGWEFPVTIFTSQYDELGITMGASAKLYLFGKGKGIYIGPHISFGQYSYILGNTPFYEFGWYAAGKLGVQIRLSNLFALHLAGMGGLFTSPSYSGLTGSINLGMSFSM